jgi:hypothetical protein
MAVTVHCDYFMAFRSVLQGKVGAIAPYLNKGLKLLVI